MKEKRPTHRLSKRRTVLKAVAGAGIGGSGLVSVTGAASAKKCDKEVDKNGNKGEYDTIQKAVNEASEGDTIKVWPGTYDEQVLLYNDYRSDDLTIIGDPGKPSEVGPGPDAPKVSGNIAEDQKAAGFRLGRRKGITIKGFEISDFNQSDWGVGIKGGQSEITVSDNHLYNLSADGVGRAGWGHIQPDSFTVKRNKIENVGHIGIRLDNVSDSIIRQNDVRGPSTSVTNESTSATKIGIHLHTNIGNVNQSGDETNGIIAKNNIITNNSVNGNFDTGGIRILCINRNSDENEQETDAVLKNVKIRGNSLKVPESFALVLDANSENGETARCENINIVGNQMEASLAGIVVHRANKGDKTSGFRNVSISGNDVKENDWGFYLTKSIQGDEITITRNNIEGNIGCGLQYEGVPTLMAERNYWGSPTGPTRKNPAGKFVGKGDKVVGHVDVKPWMPKEI